jgi:group I intron endonuclease
MSESGVYRIRNVINGKSYIGSAVNLVRRRKRHFSDLKEGNHGNRYLQNAWNKYGKKNFRWKVIKECDKEDLVFWEQLTINLYKNAFGWDNLYNICPTAYSLLGVKLPPRSLETRKKLSEAHKGKKHTLKTREYLSKIKMGNKSNLGRHLTEEHKKHISEGCKGRVNSLETRKKLSEALTGRVFTEEHKYRIACTHKGMLGKKHSEETKLKMSINHKGMLGKKHSMKSREKMSLSGKKRCANKRLFLERV